MDHSQRNHIGQTTTTYTIQHATQTPLSRISTRAYNYWSRRSCSKVCSTASTGFFMLPKQPDISMSNAQWWTLQQWEPKMVLQIMPASGLHRQCYRHTWKYSCLLLWTGQSPYSTCCGFHCLWMCCRSASSQIDETATGKERVFRTHHDAFSLGFHNKGFPSGF